MAGSALAGRTEELGYCQHNPPKKMKPPLPRPGGTHLYSQAWLLVPSPIPPTAQPRPVGSRGALEAFVPPTPRLPFNWVGAQKMDLQPLTFSHCCFFSCIKDFSPLLFKIHSWLW